MNLARMMTDRFFIEHQDGTRSGPFKTKFGGSTILVFQDELAVAEGDRIIQPLPDGSERAYMVEGCSFSTGSRNIASHWSVKISEPVATQAAIKTTGDAAIASPAEINHLQEVAAAIRLLAQAIECSDFPSEQKNEAQAILRALVAHPVVAAMNGGR